MLNINMLCRKEIKNARTEDWSCISKVAVQLPRARNEVDTLERKAQLPTGVMTFEGFSGKIPGRITAGWQNGAMWENTPHCPRLQPLPFLPPTAWRKSKKFNQSSKASFALSVFLNTKSHCFRSKKLVHNKEVIRPSWKQHCNCFKSYGFSWQNELCI